MNDGTTLATIQKHLLDYLAHSRRTIELARALYSTFLDRNFEEYYQRIEEFNTSFAQCEYHIGEINRLNDDFAEFQS